MRQGDLRREMYIKIMLPENTAPPAATRNNECFAHCRVLLKMHHHIWREEIKQVRTKAGKKPKTETKNKSDKIEYKATHKRKIMCLTSNRRTPPVPNYKIMKDVK